jgi:hypothetical protein
MRQVGAFPFFWGVFFSNGVFVHCSTRGVQKHHKTKFGGVHVENFLQKK